MNTSGLEHGEVVEQKPIPAHTNTQRSARACMYTPYHGIPNLHTKVQTRRCCDRCRYSKQERKKSRRTLHITPTHFMSALIIYGTHVHATGSKGVPCSPCPLPARRYQRGRTWVVPRLGAPPLGTFARRTATADTTRRCVTGRVCSLRAVGS